MTPIRLESRPDTRRNGIDLAQVRRTRREVTVDPQARPMRVAARTRWQGGMRSETVLDGIEVGRVRPARRFRVLHDAPEALSGGDTAPTAQEALLAALNAGWVASWVCQAALHGVRLESLAVEAHGELDLRGVFGLDPTVKPGFDTLYVTVRVKADAPEARLRELHEIVRKTAPSVHALAWPVRVESRLALE